MSLSRRKFMWQVGAGLAATPLLLRAESSLADPAGPRRVMIFFSPNGPQFLSGPTNSGGAERDFTIHRWWAPLERHKADAIFFRECHQAGVPFGTHNEYGHQSGTIGALTARTTMGTNTATGPSLDQFIGQELLRNGVVLPKRSLLWGLSERSTSAFYEGRYENGQLVSGAQEVKPNCDPYRALADIAPSFRDPSDLSAVRALQRQHFVLDHLRDDCRRLRAELGSQGRDMLDRHCANIEALEASVAQTLQPGSRACEMPSNDIFALPQGADWKARNNRDHAMAAFTELSALAFACDVTRVIGFGFGHGADRFEIPERKPNGQSYGVPASGVVNSQDSGEQMHAWTHQVEDDPNTYRALEIFYNWFAEKVATVVDKLKTTLDADGRPLFETTLVLWTSEFGGYRNAPGHTNASVPVILLGNGAGRFQTGRMFEATGNNEQRALPLHQLFVSICRHAGLSSVDTFGNAGRGPLEWLEG